MLLNLHIKDYCVHFCKTHNFFLKNTMNNLNLNEQRILDFILNEIDINKVRDFVKEKSISNNVQEELWENYPETFLKIAKEMTLSQSITLKIICSKNPLFLDIIVKKQLTDIEQLYLVKHVPERVKEHQEFLKRNEDGTFGCLFPPMKM